MTDPTEDLLADVFEGTEDAPLPVGMRDRGFGCRWLWPSPEDPRWQVEMRFLPSGELSWVGDVRPRTEAP